MAPVSAALCFGQAVQTESLLQAALAFPRIKEIASTLQVFRDRAAADKLVYSPWSDYKLRRNVTLLSTPRPGSPARKQTVGLGSLSEELHDAIMDFLTPVLARYYGWDPLEALLYCQSCVYSREAAFELLGDCGVDLEDTKVLERVDDMVSETRSATGQECNCAEQPWHDVCDDPRVQKAVEDLLKAYRFTLAAPLSPTPRGGHFATSYVVVPSWTHSTGSKRAGRADGVVVFGKSRDFLIGAGSHEIEDVTEKETAFSGIKMDNALLQHIVASNARERMLSFIHRFRLQPAQAVEQHETAFARYQPPPPTPKVGTGKRTKPAKPAKIVADPGMMALVLPH